MGRGRQEYSAERVTAFRLARHHLTKGTVSRPLASVAGEMAGAQAQMLSAAQMSLGMRVAGAGEEKVASAVWRDRTLVRSWCMRRTMFLVPSSELALFVRGSARRAEREVKWVRSRGLSGVSLEKLLTTVLDILDEPCTQREIGDSVAKSLGYKLRHRSGGGGWGNRRRQPWLDTGVISLPAGYLLHLAAARGVICSGSQRGGESTFVRGDRWVPKWKDIRQERAEEDLLRKYLRAFGPATVEDYAVWTGMLVSDAKEIWGRLGDEIAGVVAEGRRAGILASDIQELEDADAHGHSVKLLPHFDSFVLGHRSHRNIVDESNHPKIYRPQGWVSPTVLVDGRARGVWSFIRERGVLEVRISAFSKLPKQIASLVEDEATRLGSYLGSPNVRTMYV